MRHFTILCGQITAMNTLLIRVFQTYFNRFVVPSLSQIDKINVRLVNGIFWSFIGSITYQGLTLLATIPVARLLGPSGYGELGIIQSTLMTFMVFSGLSLGQTATKYVAELRSRDPERVGRIIGLTSTVGLVISALLGLVLYYSVNYETYICDGVEYPQIWANEVIIGPHIQPAGYFSNPAKLKNQP
jgi:Na+-driven multidrug efflux pump